ncbi:serine/threonine protein kinase [Bacillus sp. FJAT-27245]|uniref:serine/threonine protein kinase n=1 Tax=Bacillus sp. FJAT-27245 TaxID=1684144 RepID=UPI0006A7E948|nr:protein kinase [Bacillus sp. FJAT-27245]
MFKSLMLAISDAIERPFPKGMAIDCRYRIEALLGSGGYGHSYLAFDMAEGRPVVLKTLRLHKRLSVRGRESFRTEQFMLQQTSHPALPDYYRSGTHEEIPFFVMEYKQGKTVEQLVFQEGNSYTEKEAFGIADKLLRILDYLHSIHIIHRDIRLPNILMHGDEVYLIDLGLARKAEKSNGKFPGSHNRLRKAKNRQSDFYGLGHFLLFLLYSSYTPAEGQAERSWEEELQISRGAKTILKRLLLIESEYNDCTEIRRDIGKLLYEGERRNVVI